MKCNWLEVILNSTEDSPSPMENSLRELTLGGQTKREKHTYWHNMKFDHTKHAIEQFAMT